MKTKLKIVSDKYVTYEQEILWKSSKSDGLNVFNYFEQLYF